MPDCLNIAGAVNVTFLVLVSNAVQIILQAFQQRYQKLLSILLATQTSPRKINTKITASLHAKTESLQI